MKAVLLFDPNRRDEQLAFVRDRAEILHEFGDHVWVSMAEEQAERFAGQGIQVQRQEAADLIELPAVIFDPEEQEPAPPGELRAAEPAGEDTAHWLVQFKVAPEPGWVHAIEDLGGIFVEEVPVHAAAFRLTSAQAAGARELGDFVSWVGLFHPAYALSFQLAGRTDPFPAPELGSLRVDPDAVATRPEGAARVSFFADVAMDDARAAVEAAGAEVVEDRGFDLVVNVPTERVPDLLRVPGVRSLEPHRAPQLSNQRAGLVLGANQVRNFGSVDFLVNLDGEGEIVGVFDTGLDNGATPTTHTDFNVAGGPASRIISIDNLNPPPVTSADFDGHGTHVTGSIAANGQNAPPPTAASPNNSVPRGVAPACRVVFTSVNAFNVPPPAPPAPPCPPPAAGLCLPPPPPPPLPLSFARFMTAFENHYAAGARVHSNSWGASGDNSYDDGSSAIDLFAFRKPDAVVLFAAGNAETDLDNDGTFDQRCLGGEVTTKNILVIGASENVTSLDGDSRGYQTSSAPCNRFGTGAANPVTIAASAATPFSRSDNADHIAMFSNRGRVKNPAHPTRLRVKPDLVAPGTNVLSTRATPMTLPPTVRQCCPPIANPPGLPNPRIARTAPQGLYAVFSGTSMATPLAAGSCLLVRQFYRQRFGQLRRPLLLERETALVDLPAVALHPAGLVMGWIHHDATGPNHAVAALFNRQLVRTTPIVQIATSVGDHPAVALATHGGNTLVLHRDGGGVLHLSLRDGALAPVASFGASGSVALSPASRTEDDRRPTLAVHGDEVGVVWFQTGTDNLVFQRFRADTGAAIDSAARTIGAGSHTSSHPYLLHNGARWAAFWRRTEGANFQVAGRFVDNSGNPEGAQPMTLVTQSQELREPHGVWDPRQSRFLVAYSSGTAPPDRGVRAVRVNADGTVPGAPVTSVPLPATATSRRPRVGLHPDHGFVLAWEDSLQGTQDVYLCFLDDTGAPGAVSRMQVSDTPVDTSGFSCLADADGAAVIWQSSDEINSDVLGVYALAVTRNGVYQAQADPATPLLEQQFHVPQRLFEHGDPTADAVAVAWGGGDFYLLRVAPDGASRDLFLVRTDADGNPATGFGTFGTGGAVRIARTIVLTSACLSWTGNRLIAGSSTSIESSVSLLEADGSPVTTFGAGGTLSIGEPPAPGIFLQTAHTGTGAAFRVLVAYGRRPSAGPQTIRYTVRNAAGASVVAPRDLAEAAGTATQGWFHLTAPDAPVHLIAAWHVQAGGATAARLNRFRLDGTPQPSAATPIALTSLAGDAQNAVLAPRPVLSVPAFPPSAGDNLNARRREYGAAWQHRPAGGRWQVMFSRLQRDGRPSTTASQVDVVVARSAAEDHVEPQLAWHTDGYGLAWLRQAAGGRRQLFFTVLDENGVRPNLAASGPAAPATDFPVSTAAADVKRFHLVWTGRSFRITWTEEEGGRLRHMERGVAAPHAASGARFDAPFQQPSSALVRATLVNGATNIRNTALPNAGPNVNDGYGWGRINLRQSLAPAPPVTFHVRDDGVVGSGRTVRYSFRLAPETQLLRITLAWTDPPGSGLVNPLHLRVTTPAFQGTGPRVLHGNRWQTAAGSTHLSAPVTGAQPPFEETHNIQQVVIAGPPALPTDPYLVEVIGGAFGGSAFQPFPGQPFALVFVGSGPEVRTAPAAPAGPAAVY